MFWARPKKKVGKIFHRFEAMIRVTIQKKKAKVLLECIGHSTLLLYSSAQLSIYLGAQLRTLPMQIPFSVLVALVLSLDTFAVPVPNPNIGDITLEPATVTTKGIPPDTTTSKPTTTTKAGVVTAFVEPATVTTKGAPTATVTTKTTVTVKLGAIPTNEAPVLITGDARGVRHAL
ncbi:hypothetical protein B0H19DRAFT_1056627 [Mycena capillaripes]|nr:hypothetical protein B0H19DRAFT_1056627 [Mycena capillaripes]